jgi:2,5-diketo-D-gluconate reductase B
MYDNEAAVGEGIDRAAVPREEVVVATKVHPDNLSCDDAKRTARESLDRLDLETVDLLYVHWPTSAYDAEETLAAFDELYDDGVMDHVGLSNFTPALLDEARDLLDAPVAAHQVECHPLLPQEELRAYAREHDHYLVGYSPLGGGEILDDPLLSEIAEKHGISTAEVCLAWAFEQEALVPIPKGVGDHVHENFDAQDVTLDDEDLDRIAEYDERERVIDPDAAAWNQ